MNHYTNLNSLIDSCDIKVCIVGLGYVGLPLAIEFGNKIKTIGFDIDNKRLNDLRQGIDTTLEIEKEDLLKVNNLFLTSNPKDLKEADIYIVTVPTPIDTQNKPDLSPLIKASEMIGSVVSKGNIVIYESTVYPGASEEVCVPLIENISGLSFNEDFYLGYSPERINPGDREHTITNILKVTSGSSPESADIIDRLYKLIILAGTYKASSIKVAEAAKVIENTQRDVNIGLVNELALIFNKLDIDTEEVLKAAGTKWNFLPFRPGLVGGHCIGVDPYYLTHKAQSVGFHPEMILAGRRTNDSMGQYIANYLVQSMKNKSIKISNSKALIMGFTFKEDCPDVRNTKVIDVINELRRFKIDVSCYDPWIDQAEVNSIYDINTIDLPEEDKYDAIIITVAHQKFKDLGSSRIRSWGKNNHILFDLKYIFDPNETDLRI
tara:strand:+ start:1205 stop:2509 length:1305 start_codon:yes stop_codon:yes gene_type:complete